MTRLSIVATQTIQVTCYLASAVFFFLLFCTMVWARWRDNGRKQNREENME